MSPLMEQVVPGVWVARGSRRQWLGVRPHPHDRAAATDLPRRRAEEILASRALLRHLLSATLPGLAGKAVDNDEHGRPTLAGHPETGISISHDGEALAVAVAAHRRVGVDVQLPPDTVPEGLLRRCLRAHTQDVITLPPKEQAVELAWTWTAQEACVKAAGTGLAGRPWTIDIPPGRRRGQWGEYAWVSLRGRSRTPLSCAFSDPHGDLETLCS